MSLYSSFDLSAFDSALRSAQAQSARGNAAGVERALEYARAELAKLRPNDPRFATQHARYAAQVQATRRNLARPPESIARYQEGVAGAERAQSTYRDYSDVRRPINDDLAEAADATRRDLTELAKKWGPPAGVLALVVLVVAWRIR